MYRDDLPSPQLFPAEFRRWRIKYAEEEELAGSCATALKQCDEDAFPNIFPLLKILSTLPVTSCECERSFSAMRRLNTYMRCTMSENRLMPLALMHIQYEMQIDLEEVVELFATMHQRMLELSNFLWHFGYYGPLLWYGLLVLYQKCTSFFYSRELRDLQY